MPLSFDADAFLATLEPPTLTLGGVEHVGRHLSAAQWMQALAAWDRAQVTGSFVAFAEVGRVVYDAMYPPPPAPPAPRGWASGRRRRPVPQPPASVWQQLLAGPPVVWQRGLEVFFASPLVPPTPATTERTGAESAAPSPSDGLASS